MEPTLALVDSVRLGRRMDFDTEVLVRLHWRGVRVVSVPTRVVYPANGVSNFRLWGDNVAISWMHTKLVLGMLIRLPVIIGRRLARHFRNHGAHLLELADELLGQLRLGHVRRARSCWGLVFSLAPQRPCRLWGWRAGRTGGSTNETW